MNARPLIADAGEPDEAMVALAKALARRLAREDYAAAKKAESQPPTKASEQS